MDSESWLELGVVAICLMLAGYVGMADTALRFINRGKLQRLIDDGMSKAEAVERFLERPGELASTVVFVNTLTIIVASSLATVLVLRHFSSQYGAAMAAVLGFVVITSFSQIVPRLIAARNPEGTSVITARPLEMMATVLSPLIQGAKLATNGIGRLTGVEQVAEHAAESPLVTEEDLRLMIDEEGIVEEDEREMIHGIFELEETTAREIMVPRIDIHALEASKTISDAIDVIVDCGYSRIPVFEDSIDEIVGILYSKDLFKQLKGCSLETPIRDIVRPAHFIPESKKIDELLREFKQKKVHIAIVVDEYGGTAGLVTIEDLLEEIVGEIQDEYDIEEAKIVELGDGQAVFDATVSIDDVNDTLGLKLEAEDVDTIAGLVYTQLGKMPTAGDEVRIDGVVITVLATDGRRIKKVKVVGGDLDTSRGQ